MKMKDYTFKNFNSGAGFWKCKTRSPNQYYDLSHYSLSHFTLSAAFIGMTCAVVVCICFALVAMCMKRRNYVQPGGASWSVSHSAPTSVVSRIKKLVVFHFSNLCKFTIYFVIHSFILSSYYLLEFILILEDLSEPAPRRETLDLRHFHRGESLQCLGSCCSTLNIHVE